MKIGIVYTGTTPELIERVEAEIHKTIGGDVTLMNYQNSEILDKIKTKGYVTTEPAVMLCDLFLKAMGDGVDAILNACSSVGETADAFQDFAKYCGVPVVRIDEAMCREAIRLGRRIGVMATLPTTMNPTKATLLRLAREMNREVELVDGLVDGAFGLNPKDFAARLVEVGKSLAQDVDVLLFCQGSMAYCEEIVAKETGIQTLSSPKFGAIALKEALIQKGVLSC